MDNIDKLISDYLPKDSYPTISSLNEDLNKSIQSSFGNLDLSSLAGQMESFEPFDPMEETNEHLSDIKSQHDVVIQQLMEANNSLHKQIGVLEGQFIELKELNKKNENQLFVLNAQMRQMMNDSQEQKHDIKVSRIISLVSLAVAVLSLLLQYWPS